MSSFTKSHYKAIRVSGTAEYLERPPQWIAHLKEDLPPNIVTLISEAEGLLMEYQCTGVLGRLNDATKALHTASSNIPEDDPHLANVLSSYEAVMDLLHVTKGEIRGPELDHAIKVAEKAVLLTPEDDLYRPARLSYLSSWIGRRFDWHGHAVDGDRAIEKAEQAAASSSIDHDPQAAAMQNNLGFWFVQRFDHARNLKDLDRAVEASEAAVGLTPADDPLLATRQHNLAVRRLKRFHETGQGVDFTCCVEIANKSVSSPGILEFDKSLLLVNLGNIYLARFQQSKQLSSYDIDEAVKCFSKAVEDAAALCHLNYADCQLYLGECLMKRYQLVRNGDTKDLDNALQAFRRSWNYHHARPWTQVTAARRTAELLALQGDWHACSDILAEAVKLLHFVNMAKNSEFARQQLLSKFQGLAAEAAAVALEAGRSAYDALNQIESGRSLANNFSADVDAFEYLGIQCPKMWDYGMKRDKLDSSVICILLPVTESSRRHWDVQIENEHTVRRELEDIVKGIRMNPPWQSFLQLRRFEELVSEASEGPIVLLNATSYRCDAFVVGRSGVSTIRLETITLGEVQQKARDLRIGRRLATTLAWLWINVAHPIIHGLGFKTVLPNIDPPRIFWILPGFTASFPLHAAGYHFAGSTEAVIDKVMSTYCSSIKTLIYSRRKARVEFGGSGVDKALLVSMEETDNLDKLPDAPIEVAKVKELCHSLDIHPVVLTLPNQSDLRDHFFDCKIFHFAGHALTDPINPLASCLCLRDWVAKPLTVESLMHDFRVGLHSPFLAYLSACSTGAIEDDLLADEGLHLIGVYQQSHFRHVIGCLSPVSDQHCVKVAELVYKTLQERGITDWSICLGLHIALKSLREAGRGSVYMEPGYRTNEIRDGRILFANHPGESGVQLVSANTLHWVPYVHFGV